MRKARRLAFVVAVASALLAATACTTDTTTPQNGNANTANTNGATTTGTAADGYQHKAKKQGEKVYIGFSMDTLKEERWNRDKQLVEARGAEVGAQVETQVANGDDAVQTKQCDNFLTKGVDVLIVAPHNGEIAASIVQNAHARGVPVISYDRLIKNSDVDLYVSHQVVKMGEMQGDYALKHAPKGNYVLIGGAPTDNNAMLLRQGQENILKPAEARGDIKIVSNQFAKEWKAEEAQRLTEDALTKTNRDITAIVASNDGTAGGAISALQAAGIADGKVLVTGQDAQLDAVQRIAKGTQTMTIYKPIKPLADSAVDAALKLAYGQPLDAKDKVNNGKLDVPSILQEPQAVDKDNLDATIIKDGYHKCEDVYKDVPGHECPKASAAVGGEQRAVSSPLAAALSLLLTAFGSLLVFKVTR
jgi:D-xylose transport system substrate-binding protein